MYVTCNPIGNKRLEFQSNSRHKRHVIVTHVGTRKLQCLKTPVSSVSKSPCFDTARLFFSLENGTRKVETFKKGKLA